MRVVALEHLRQMIDKDEGGRYVLAKDLIAVSNNASPIVLGRQGLVVRKESLARLMDNGLDYIFIDDQQTKAVEITLPVGEYMSALYPKIHEELYKRARPLAERLAQENNEWYEVCVKFRTAWPTESSACRIYSLELKKIANDIAYMAKKKYFAGVLETPIYYYKPIDYMKRHPISVAFLSACLAVKLGDYSSAKLFNLVMGALMCDIALAVSDFGKKDNAYFWIEKHPRIACMIINETNGLNSQMGIVTLEHHRYIDNMGIPTDLPEKDWYGYPREMYEMSRLVSIVEHFCALKMYYNPQKVKEAMRAFRGTYFDAKMFDLFYEKVSPYGMGEEYILSDGRRCIISGINEVDLNRPRVVILKDNDPEEAEELDLLKHGDIQIAERAERSTDMLAVYNMLYRSEILERLKAV